MPVFLCEKRAMTQQLTEDKMYRALVERDSRFEGVFYVGVKTTGIFCRNTCTARKPKRENVAFYGTTREAITHGYRPCKVCKPLLRKDETPAFITKLLQEIAQNPEVKITDYDLRQREIDPVGLRRWFQRHHGMTFHAFQRLLRINNAISMIKSGEKVSSAAYDNGYDSLSGFAHSIKKNVGLAPKDTEAKNVITSTRITTPLGPMLAAATDEGICLLEFTDRKALETELRDLQQKLNAVILPGNHPNLELLQTQLAEYFTGKRTNFDLPLVTPGTAFQQQVWSALQEIPYGETRSYKMQAERVGNPKGVRAVATANGCNRIAIVIPCHRVIGSDGSLTGYAGGIWRKQWLLEHEAKFAG